MIYCAALHQKPLDVSNFIDVISHNLEFTREYFEFTADCESFRLPHHKWSLTLYCAMPTEQYQHVTCPDLTLAIIFNHKWEQPHVPNPLLIPSVLPAMEEWIKTLVNECHTFGGVRQYSLENGNTAVILQKVQRYDWLARTFGY